MIKKTIVIFLIAFARIPVTTWAQQEINILNNSNLLYLVDEDSLHHNDYMVPYIEWALKSLTVAGTDSIRVFDTVRSMNILLSQKGRPKLATAFSSHNFSQYMVKLRNRSILIYDSSLLRQLYKFQYFLVIKINTFQSLLEYQFIISKIDPADTNANEHIQGLPFIDNNNYTTSSVFIDPASVNYKEKILQALKQLIIKANEKPKPSIATSCAISNGTIHLEVNKETEFDALENDKDSPKDQLSYRWEIKDSAGHLLYKSTDKKIKYKFPHAASYKIRLFVNDGIEVGSIEYTVEARNLPPISISSPDRSFYDYTYHYYSFSRRNRPASVEQFARNLIENAKMKAYDWQSARSYYFSKYNYRELHAVVCSDPIFLNNITINERQSNNLTYDSTNMIGISLGETPPGGGSFFEREGDDLRFSNKGKDGDDKMVQSGHVLDCQAIAIYVKKEDEKYPGEKVYQLKVEANGLKNSRNIFVSYHKLQPFAITAELSGIFNDHHSQYSQLSFFGIGGKAYIIPAISILASAGVSFLVKNTTQTFPLNDIATFRVGGDLNIISGRKGQLSVQAIYLNRPVISRDYSFVEHVGQVGFGLSSMLMISSQNEITSPIEVFFTYYSHISLFNNTVADLYEFGVKYNIFFERRLLKP